MLLNESVYSKYFAELKVVNRLPLGLSFFFADEKELWDYKGHFMLVVSLAVKYALYKCIMYYLRSL